MSILSKLFGGHNPMDAANQYLNQIPGQGHQTYDPYIDRGRLSGDNAHKQYEDLMNDPQGFINRMMSGYQESDAYKYQSDKLGRAMSNTAAAGGIAGTPLDQMNQAEQLQKLLSADQQQYLQNVLGRYDLGLGGEQGEADRGYDASQKLNDLITGGLNQQGGLAFNNAQQKNAQRIAFFKMMAKALGGAAGGVFGGVPGATLGSNIFG